MRLTTVVPHKRNYACLVLDYIKYGDMHHLLEKYNGTITEEMICKWI